MVTKAVSGLRVMGTLVDSSVSVAVRFSVLGTSGIWSLTIITSAWADVPPVRENSIVS